MKATTPRIFPVRCILIRNPSVFLLSSLSSPRCYTFIMPPHLFAIFVAGYGTHLPLLTDMCVRCFFVSLYSPSSVSLCLCCLGLLCLCSSLSSTLFVIPPHALVRFPSSVVAGYNYSFCWMAEQCSSCVGWPLLPCSSQSIQATNYTSQTRCLCLTCIFLLIICCFTLLQFDLLRVLMCSIGAHVTPAVTSSFFFVLLLRLVQPR